MPKLLEGKTALVLGVWNKWSIAYAIAQAFTREGAKLLLTYQNERAKPTVEELGKGLGAVAFYPCDVQQQSDIDALAASLKAGGEKPDVIVHCLAFCNHEDLNQPFVNTSRDGFNLALDVSAYSLVALSRALAPLMTEGGAIMTLTYLVNLWLAGRVVRVSGHLRRPWPDLSTTALPTFASALVVAVFALSFLAGLPGIMAMVLTASLLMAFGIVGFAVLHVITRNIAARGVLLGATYLAVVILHWPVIMLMALGLVDAVFDLRGRLNRGRGPPPTSP